MKFHTRLSYRIKHLFKPKSKQDEFERVRHLYKNKSGFTDILGKPFKFHHAASFVDAYQEIFLDEIYKFTAEVGPGGIILDCGANMGLSVLYFSLNYPDHHIIAFEPDEEIFKVLEENVNAFQLKNVTLHNKAVWVKKENLLFHTDGGMGGRIQNIYKKSKKEAKEVETVVLREFLNQPIEFLKIDIEGAEVEVLQDCKENLDQVRHLFFEYHNDIQKPQSLHQLLALVKKAGFTYHLKESSTRKKPFVDNNLLCETFDMAITVFCQKQPKRPESL
jgi:FkbM family methyltransferase